MDVVAKLVLRAKAWQVFLFFVGATVLYDNVTSVALSIPLVWLWCLGASLDSLAAKNLRRDLTLLSATALLQIIYAFVFSPWVADSRPLTTPIVISSIGISLCFTYMLYFDATALVLAEYGRHANFSELAGPVLNLLFFPFGIWFIQPRINRLYEKTVLAKWTDDHP